jgi:hypothetical protein
VAPATRATLSHVEGKPRKRDLRVAPTGERKQQFFRAFALSCFRDNLFILWNFGIEDLKNNNKTRLYRQLSHSKGLGKIFDRTLEKAKRRRYNRYKSGCQNLPAFR